MVSSYAEYPIYLFNSMDWIKKFKVIIEKKSNFRQLYNVPYLLSSVYMLGSGLQ